MKRLLVIGHFERNTSPSSHTGCEAIEWVTVRGIDRAAAELHSDWYDGIVLNETLSDAQVKELLHALDRLVDMPHLFCLETKATAEFARNLALSNVSCRLISELTEDKLHEALALSCQALSNPDLTDLASADWEKTLVGHSSAVCNIRAMIRLVACRRSTVLMTGETGSGKEVVARALHLASDRAAKPIVSVNCAALPGALLESELFGHVKGAFTGAYVSRIGRFEQAHAGTIFLDEVGDMPLELQAKVLRVLQEREIQKLGSPLCTKVNVRVIAATNLDLTEAIREKRFRQDLYYRLKVVPLHIPPLRERPDDVAPLVEHFLEKICQREDLSLKRVGPGVVEHLAEQRWPGNVRELEHAVERAIALSGDRIVLDLRDFPPFCEVVPIRNWAPPSNDDKECHLDLQETMSRLEQSLINQAIEASRGNKARAAEMLGLKRSTLISKVKAYA